MNRGLAHYKVIVEHFTAKVGKKVPGEVVLGNYGIDLWNDRGQTYVDFAENH